MSFFASCPKCGCSYAKGSRCPQCRYTDNPDAGYQEENHAAEYGRRYETHRRHYMIWMGLLFALTTVSILLACTVFVAMRAPRTTQYVASGMKPTKVKTVTPQPAMPAENDPDDADDPPDLPEPAGSPTPIAPEMSMDDLGVGFNPPAGLLFFLVGLLAAEGALTFAVWKSKDWWPVNLNCPGCNIRLDELGENPEHCPSCQTRLR